MEGLMCRGLLETECMQGEPQLLCKDLWRMGYGKIAAVPTVNLEYTIEMGRRLIKTGAIQQTWLERQILPKMPSIG